VEPGSAINDDDRLIHEKLAVSGGDAPAESVLSSNSARVL
jgi:hypothetical protein